jgi:rhodanese-related sulfurtransferase
MCGKTLSDEAVSTLGEQRKYNYALQPMSKEEFMKLVEVDQPEAPGYFVHDAILNRKERASLDASMRETLKPLSLDEVLQLQKQGAQVLDTRDAAEFSGAHLRGALNIGIDGKYATWAGTVLDKESPIVIIADEDRVSESVMRLGRIGFDHVAGYLEHGMDALAGHESLLARSQRITPLAASEMEDAKVVDVRSKSEWEAGHIAGSVNIPLNQLPGRIDEIPAAGDVIVHCQGGYRSALAVSLLQQHGRDNLFDMVGGFKAWKQCELPVVQVTSA